MRGVFADCWASPASGEKRREIARLTVTLARRAVMLSATPDLLAAIKEPFGAVADITSVVGPARQGRALGTAQINTRHGALMLPERVGEGKLERRRMGESWHAPVATPLEGNRPPLRGLTAQQLATGWPRGAPAPRPAPPTRRPGTTGRSVRPGV